jgi:hypothetical protein
MEEPLQATVAQSCVAQMTFLTRDGACRSKEYARHRSAERAP